MRRLQAEFFSQPNVMQCNLHRCCQRWEYRVTYMVTLHSLRPVRKELGDECG